MPGGQQNDEAWEQILDPATKRYYYYNAATGKATWTLPAAETGKRNDLSREISGNTGRRGNAAVGDQRSENELLRQRERAATIMQKHVRGSHDRKHLKDESEREYKTHQEDRPLPIDPESVGLKRYAETHRGTPQISDELRYGVRDVVVKLLLKSLGMEGASLEEGVQKIFERIGQDCNTSSLPQELKAQLARARLFVDAGPPEYERMAPLMSDHYLLGGFDVVAVPIRPSFNIFFKETPQRGWFWVLHAAAINIGEGSGSRACDFRAYSIANAPKPTLNTEAYVNHMGRLWRNILLTMSYIGVDDGILFPFGMGAFLRNLGDCDSTFKDPQKRKWLRQRVAQELMRAIVSFCIPRNAPKRVHLCLVCAEAESIDNHNVFVEAAGAKAKECPALAEVLQIHRNTDVMQLATDLTADRQDLKVAILNGANRKMLGNHWFSGGARRAIDENMHRRSVSMAATSLMLNGGITAQQRDVNDLPGCMWFYGGKVYSIDGCEIAPPDPSKVARVAVHSRATSSGALTGSASVGSYRNNNSNGSSQSSTRREANGRAQESDKQLDEAATRIKNIFRNADKNGDGMISIEELTVLLRLLGDFNDRQLRDMFLAMDRNGDKKVSYDEFVDWILQIERGEAMNMGEEAQFIMNQVTCVPWNVIGVQNSRQVAPQPDKDCAVLDALELHDIKNAGPSTVQGNSVEIYRFLGIGDRIAFSDSVKRCIKHCSEAKCEVYDSRSGYRTLIHVAIPDLRCARPVAVRNLQTAFENALNEFANSGLQCLRLAPLGNISKTKALPEMTVEALRIAFEGLSREQKHRVRTASIEFCCFTDAEHTAFKRSFLQ